MLTLRFIKSKYQKLFKRETLLS